jgi:hypothetical protein
MPSSRIDIKARCSVENFGQCSLVEATPFKVNGYFLHQYQAIN